MLRVTAVCGDDDGMPEADIRSAQVRQRGGGHMPPLGGYDAPSDAFLVLDLNLAAAGRVWMPTATRVQRMRYFDTVENRAACRVSPAGTHCPSRALSLVVAPVDSGDHAAPLRW